jgi:CBS domain-containing protein
MGDLTALDRPAPQDRIERSLMNDSVSILKPNAPAIVQQTANVAEALSVLLGRDVGAVLVVGESGQLVGIFSERDLLRKIAGLDTPLESLLVQHFMTPQPETVGLRDKLAFALHKMDVGGYRHLPVVEDGIPVGMLSVRDIIRHMTSMCSS